jgi:CelD/BcsL family acetyltransferase involved in cellulose biosynthesis
VSLVARPWQGLAAFRALARPWDELVHAAALDSLCNSHAWCLAYAEAFAREEDVFGWCFEEGSATVALVALRREPSRGTLALRRALFVADGTFDSDYLEPPIRPGHERAVAAALIDAARAKRGLEALVLAGLRDESPFLGALRSELAERGLAQREHAMPCLATPLGETFEATLSRFKPRMRSKVRSAMRAAAARGARLAWCTEAGELGTFLEELFTLHERRWQAEGRSGSFADPRRRAFYLQLARAALACGELCLARLQEPGGTSAVQFGIQKGPRYYQIQEGFDPARESERVGTALRGLALEALIARGVRHYDFMAGDSAHKRDWGGELRPCTTLAFPLPRWRARLAYHLRERLEHLRESRSSGESR